MNLPLQLQNANFRFVLLKDKSKVPLEPSWTTYNNYPFDDPRLLSHLSRDSNYGVLCGAGDLVILDVDVPEIIPQLEKMLPETFTVQTGSGKFHFYYIAARGTPKVIFDKNAVHYGELQATGAQCVGPGSIHPATNQKYVVVKDIPIANLTTMKIAALKELFKDKEFQTPDWSQYKPDNISSQIPITKLVDLTKCKKFHNEYYMAHPIHGSETGMNFFINPDKNLWHCFRHDSGGDSLALVSMQEGICNCEDFSKSGKRLKGSDFIKTMNIAKIKYNIKDKDAFEISLLNNTANPSFSFLWESELKNYVVPVEEWIVDKFIRPGSIGVLAGKRGTMKSFFSLALAYCIATGTKLFDKYNVQKSNVLYIDRENGFWEIKNRCKMLAAGLNITANADIGFIAESQLKLDDVNNIAELERLINERKMKVIFVDTYRRMISFDENDAGQVSRLFVDILKPLCFRTGVCFILLHHERKGQSQGDEMDMLRGSSDLANYVDWVLQIERRGNKITLKQTKQRNAKELEPFVLTTETNEVDFFKFIYNGEPTTVDRLIGRELINWALTNNLTEFTYTEGWEKMQALGFKETKYKYALSELVQSGDLTKEDSYGSPYKIVVRRREETQETLE
jgi:hypothetical protein